MLRLEARCVTSLASLDGCIEGDVAGGRHRRRLLSTAVTTVVSGLPWPLAELRS